MKNCVVFVGMAPGGIIRHFVLFSAKAKVLVEAQGVDFFFAATNNQSGTKAAIWAFVKETFRPDRIITATDYQSVAEAIGGLLQTYDKVVVHFQGGRMQLDPLIPFKKAFGDRFVLIAVTQYFRNDSWRRVPMSIYQYFLYSKYVDLVNFQSPYSVRSFVGGERLYRMGKGTVIPMGCDPCPKVVSDVPDAIRQAGLAEVLEDTTLFKFVYLAAFRPGKRHEWLVRSVAEQLKGHRHVRMIFCGTFFEPTVEQLRETIRKYGVENQVFLSNFLPHSDLPWLLAHVNCAIVPSVSETFGHTFIEPMMAGLPLIGTRVGAGEYVIRDYETGLSFELGDPITLRRAFTAVVEHPDLAKRMGAQARKLAEIMFSFEEVAKMWLGTYMRFLEDKSKEQK